MTTLRAYASRIATSSAPADRTGRSLTSVDPAVDPPLKAPKRMLAVERPTADRQHEEHADAERDEPEQHQQPGVHDTRVGVDDNTCGQRESHCDGAAEGDRPAGEDDRPGR